MMTLPIRNVVMVIAATVSLLQSIAIGLRAQPLATQALPGITKTIARLDLPPAQGVTELQRRLIALEGGLIFGRLPCSAELRWDATRGVTVGCLQFGLLGRLQPILAAMDRAHPDLFVKAFGSRVSDVRQMLQLPTILEQAAWGRSLANREGQLTEPWATSFAALIAMPEFQGVYLEATNARFRMAIDWTRRFGFRSRQGVAMMFDMALFRGIPPGQEAPLARLVAESASGLEGKAAELSRLWAFAEARSSMDSDDKLLRFHLEAIAKGEASFGADRVNLAAFGITPEPVVGLYFGME
jgi:hypothetical protein